MWLVDLYGIAGLKELYTRTGDDKYQTIQYTQLVNFRETEFHVCLAHNVEEAFELTKNGFTYETGEYHDGGKIFIKPK